MKKFIILAIALCSFSFSEAQNEVLTAILQHGDEATSFIGMDALKQAHEAAVDGDIITLSEGAFNSIDITKSVSIYGAGFEKDEAAGTAVTILKGLNIGNTDQAISNVRLEGVCVSGSIYLSFKNTKTIEGLVITKCFIENGVNFNGRSINTEISQSVILGNVGTKNGATAEGMLIQNCWLGTVAGFNASSSINVNNCIVTADYGGAILYTNSILANYYTPNSAIAEGSVVKNCLCRRALPGANRIVENCYVFQNFDEIFTDANDENYTSSRTFELKEPATWLGTDGTQIGILGGKGFSKIPATPTIKNITVTVDGKVLKVDYKAEVR